jgi:PAS domain S-box-containing protein
MKAQSDIIRLQPEAGGPAPQISWSNMGPHDHFVQYYEDDGFLVDSITGFVVAGIDAGEAAVVVATEPHRSALESRLKERGFNPAALRVSGQYTPLDAADTLSTFMVNGTPDSLLFDRTVGTIVRHATRNARPLRAFGEMVSLLWNEGNTAAAVRLEELWNALGQTCTFRLFCAYPMSAFRGHGKDTSLLDVCSQQSNALPAASYVSKRTVEDRLRAITVRQQKATTRDAEVAERKQAQGTALEQETRLAMAVAVARLGIWELDLLTRDLKCSDQCKAHFGLQPEEHLTYERLSEIIHPDDRETVRNTLRNAIAINGDHSSEYRVVGPGGQVRWISSLGRCFHNGEHRMIGVTLDITDRKHSADLLEQTVIERTAKLKEALSELESFSYSISHDMRAPLRSMQGFAAILMEDCGDELSPEARACLDRIAASAERMDRLIQDVLTFSRVTRSDFLMESVDLDRLIRGVIESFPNLQPPKAAIAIEGKLPLVLGNAAGLTQCLSNILGNAVKFVAHGTSPQVRVWTESAGPDRSQFVRVYIKDNGIGIPHESHEKIFEIFQRLSKRYDGTGIGLAIVKKAVERMGGKVGLTSSPDNGSTFWLELKVPA